MAMLQLDTTLIIAITSLGISLFSFFLSIVTYRNAVETQKRIFFNDLIKEERVLRMSVLEHSSDYKKELFFNYLEYLCYLILTKQINEKDAKSMLSDEVQELYNLIPRKDRNDYKSFTRIYNRWFIK